MAYISTQMVQSIKGSSKIIDIMVKENTHFRMGQYTKANGIMVLCTELAFLLIQMADVGMDSLEMGLFRQNFNNSLEN